MEKVNLDPAVFVDDDGSAYIFWGNQQCYYAEFDHNLISLKGTISKVDIPLGLKKDHMVALIVARYI
ncbi:hypothetical protein CK934_17130 [Chitinophaga sp. MD30]|nr:hypothetical protein CK934_17130 [Chitinophaga sp. MD30]